MGLLYSDASYIYGIYGTTAAIVSITGSAALDLLPAFHIILVSGSLSMIMRFLLPTLVLFCPPLVGTILLSTFMAMVDVYLSIGLMLALKRIIYAEYAGNEELRDARLDQCIALLYFLANGADSLTNYIYDTIRFYWSPVMANNMACYLSAGTMAIALLQIVIAQWYVGEADRSMLNVRKTHWDVTFREPRFWSFMFMCTVLTGVRMLFRHLDFTLPIFVIRTLGNRSHFALVQAINPTSIVILVPLVTWLLSRPWAKDRGYNIITLGTVISACGPFVIGFILLADETRVMLATAVGIAVFSVGEAIWSPRFSSYAMKIAPEGAEAVYSSLASIPALVVKLPTSALSNLLVASFCPSFGHCEGSLLWLMIGTISALTPLGLIFGARLLNEEYGGIHYFKNVTCFCGARNKVPEADG